MSTSRAAFPALLALLGATLAAADPDQTVIATERDGHAATTTPVLPGQAVASGNAASVLTLAGAPNSTITLAPGTTVSLDRVAGPDGTSLQIHLLTGTMQVDIGDKGVYSDVHSLSASLDVRVTGTLFVVERQKHDSDYVALIRGHVRVKLRQDVADILAGHHDDQVDLAPHQGLGGSTGGGLSTIDTLNTRPQLPSGAGGPSVRDQGIAANGDGGWNTDQAQTLTAPADTVITPALADAVSNQVTTAVTQSVTDQITQKVIQNTASPAPSELTGPPGPPAH